METAKGVLLLLTLALAAIAFLAFIRGVTVQKQLDQAAELATVTSEFLKAQDVRCSSNDYQGLTSCIRPLLSTDDFKQDSFQQPDSRSGETGYLVIKNTNRKLYESDRFTFFKNRRLAQAGCTIPGNIGYGVTCRFNYPGTCEDGDVLEAFYPVGGRDVRVFLKTC